MLLGTKIARGRARIDPQGMRQQLGPKEILPPSARAVSSGSRLLSPTERIGLLEKWRNMRGARGWFRWPYEAGAVSRHK